MRKITLIISFLLLSVLFLYPQGTTDKFTLIFEENFETEGAPDDAHWSYCTRQSSDWNKYLVEGNSETVEVKDGKLFLRAIKNNDRASDNVPYLTGGIKTQGKVGIKYGKVEVRAKVTEGQGSFPAIWMMPTVATYGGWPKSGEIDIMEHLNYDNYIWHTIHSEYTWTLGQQDNPKNHTTAPYNKNQFNTYSLEWYPDRLEFFVNGVKNHTYPRMQPAVEWQWPFDHEFYLILNTACDGSWGGAVNESHLPFEMEVDWVKMYQLNEDYEEEGSYNIPAWSADIAYNNPKLNDTYVENITAEGTIQPYELTFGSKPENHYTFIDQAINVHPDADFSLNLKAFSLGDYTVTTVLQDLRYTCVYAYADLDGDYTFETVLPRIGNQPPNHNVGGNFESMDATFNFKAPEVTEDTQGRIRIVYHNAWSNHANADAPISEGLVYDFNVNIKPVETNVIKVSSFNPAVSLIGDQLIIEGLSSDVTVSVFDYTGKMISNKRFSGASASLSIPNQFLIVKIQNAEGEVYTCKL